MDNRRGCYLRIFKTFMCRQCRRAALAKFDVHAFAQVRGLLTEQNEPLVTGLLALCQSDAATVRSCMHDRSACPNTATPQATLSSCTKPETAS